MGSPGALRRCRLERAIRDAGFGSRAGFARAVGRCRETVDHWVACRSDPNGGSRAAIASALQLSPGADCDEVVQADLDWLLEPCDPFGM